MYFDLETTGCQRTSDIVQIAAVCGEKPLNIHLKPNGRISEGASKVTGLTYENGILKRLGQPLVSVSADEGLKQFVMFLASSSKPFLIVHNIQNFDVPMLMHNLQKYNLVNSFQNEVSGFVDTYKLSKKVFEKSSVANFKQEPLVKTFIGIDYDAHNAMSDVTSLRLFYEKSYPYIVEILMFLAWLTIVINHHLNHLFARKLFHLLYARYLFHARSV